LPTHAEADGVDDADAIAVCLLVVPVAIAKDADVPVAAGFVTVPVVFGEIVPVSIDDFIVVARVLTPTELPVDFFSVVVACMVVGCFVVITVDATSVAGFFVVGSVDNVVDVNVAAVVILLEAGDVLMPLSTCVVSASDAPSSTVVWSAAMYVYHRNATCS
jgi:hypothetical protein